MHFLQLLYALEGMDRYRSYGRSDCHDIALINHFDRIGFDHLHNVACRHRLQHSQRYMAGDVSDILSIQILYEIGRTRVLNRKLHHRQPAIQLPEQYIQV